MPKAPQLQELADLLPQDGVQSATRLGLCLSPNLGADAWSRLVAGVAQAAGRFSGNRVTLTVWLGDLLAHGGGKYKGQIKEYALAAGLEPATLRMAKLVCSRIPVFSRRNTLSWAHHCEIGTAFREPGDIRRWLERADRDGYSKAELRRHIRAHLAASGSSDRAHVAAPLSFGLMRELRAVERFLGNHPTVWTQWSPATCRQALGEIGALAGFVEALRARASSEAPCAAVDQ
jgi:hypothetical protein